MKTLRRIAWTAFVCCLAPLALKAAHILVVQAGASANAGENDMVALLTTEGYTVSTAAGTDLTGLLSSPYLTTGGTKAQFLEGFDAVVLSRSITSNGWTDRAGWAALRKGVLSTTSFLTRSGNLGWSSAAEGSTLATTALGNPDTAVASPTHQVWNNVVLTATNTRANLYNESGTGSVNGYAAGSTFGQGVAWGSLTGATGAQAHIVAWEAGANMAHASAANLGARRLFFALSGNTNSGNTLTLNAAGRQAFLNAVAWVVFPDRPPPPLVPPATGHAGLGLLTVQASVHTTPVNAVVLAWNRQSASSPVIVSRRLLGATGPGTWQQLAQVTTYFYQDLAVTPGIAYEYRVSRAWRSATDPETAAYLVAGIGVGSADTRGRLLLVADETVAPQLSSEIDQLRADLVGEGWTVVYRTHPRHGTGTPAGLRAMVQTEHAAAPEGLKALYLLGHLPVARSGYQDPDQTADSQTYAAQPTDAPYGDVDGEWTDSRYAIPGMNMPGDGIYDQNELPGDVDLMVGRIDFANITKDGLTETALLRRYLQKAHQWRHGQTSAENRARAAVDGRFDAEISQLYPMFGASGVVEAPFGPAESGRSYLWAVGAGSTDAAEYVGHRVAFAINHVAGGQRWEIANSPARLLLAETELGLGSLWGAAPSAFFHGMGVGEPIGQSVLRTQNNRPQLAGDYFPQGARPWLARRVHVALMGDPTLRLRNALPPSNVQVTPSGSNPQITWSAPAAPRLAGYHVYRASAWNGPYERVTTAPLTGTSFTDASAGAVAGRFYMVRAVRLETSPNATWMNESVGVGHGAPPPSAPTPLQLYQTWASGHGLSGAAAAPNAAPAGDGVANLIKFATLPADVSPLGPIGTGDVVEVLSENASMLVVRYDRRKAALSAVACQIVHCENLTAGIWTSEGAIVRSTEDLGDFERVTVAIPIGSGGRRFARLEVALLP